MLDRPACLKSRASQAFGGDKSIVGRTIRADGKLRLVIGILPKDFRFLDWTPQDLLLPMQMDRNKTTLGEFNLDGIARLKPGVTIQQADADVTRMLPIVWSSFPPPPGFSLDLFKKAQVQANVIPLRQDVIGDVAGTLWIFQERLAREHTAWYLQGAFA